MKNITTVGTIILLTGVALIVSGCSSASPTPVLGFDGKILVDTGHEILELIDDPEAIQAQAHRIAGPGIQFISMSPDRRFLLYSTKDKTLLHDLKTGEIDDLFKIKLWHANWSWDSSILSFKDEEHKLWAFHLPSGNAVPITKPPSAEYNTLGVGAGSRVYGDLSNGTWIDPNHLIIQRYVGGMPYEISATRKEVNDNTTTLVSIDESWQEEVESESRVVGPGFVKLSNTEERVWVNDVSPDGSYFLVKKESDPWYISEPFLTLDAFNAHARTLPEARNYAFFPNSNDIYGIQDTEIGYQFFFMDPETLEKQLGPELSEEESDWIRRPQDSWVWLGDPQEGMVAVEDDRNVFIINLNTGNKTIILDGNTINEDRDYPDLHLVAWLSP